MTTAGEAFRIWLTRYSIGLVIFNHFAIFLRHFFWPLVTMLSGSVE
jgi:hypothetical protein